MWWVSIAAMSAAVLLLAAALISQRQFPRNRETPAAGDIVGPFPPVSPAWRTAAIASAAGVMVLGGANMLGGAASSNRVEENPVAALAAATSRLDLPASEAGNVDKLIAALAARLESSPGDADGWRMLGWSYFNTGHYGEAAEAFGRASSLVPSNTDYRSSQAEALVQAAGGTVTPEAHAMFVSVLKDDHLEFRSRFYLALFTEQSGDTAGAFDQWSALLASAPAGAEWSGGVKSRIEQLGARLGRDLSLAPALSPARPDQDMTASVTMPEAGRDAMIRGMVDGLAARLAQSPHDAGGWIKLIRSRMVLGEAGLAREALRTAVGEFASDPGSRDEILASARAMGVTLE